MQGLQAFLPGASAPRNPYRHAPPSGRSASGSRVPLDRVAVAVATLLCFLLFLSLQPAQDEPGRVGEQARPRLKGARPLLSAQPTALDLMTFNLRFAGTGDGANSWRFRKEHVAELVNRFHPAVMGTQEGLKAQLAELAALLTHPYERFGVEREQNGEFEQIFYDADVVEWLDGGNFWLSEEPDTPGTQGWDAACVRMVTWSKFRLRATGQEFFFFNTQLDHVGPKSRAEGSKLLWDRIQQITGSADVPLFLMGDFNTYRHTSTYAYFTNDENGPMLYEAWPQAEQQIGDVSYTYHGWAGVDNDGERGAVRAANHIDWIFYRPQMPVVSTEVITESRKGRYPSDHYPIQARVLFPSPAELPPPSAVY